MANALLIQYRGHRVYYDVDERDPSIIRLNNKMTINGVHPDFIERVMGPVEITIGLICGNVAGTLSTPNDLCDRTLTHIGIPLHDNQMRSLRPSEGMHDLTVRNGDLQIKFSIFFGDPDKFGLTDLPPEAMWPEGAELDPTMIQ